MSILIILLRRFLTDLTILGFDGSVFNLIVFAMHNG